MSKFGKGKVTNEEVELIREKFIELAGSFEERPQGGCNRVSRLVRKALKIPDLQRVEMVLRKHLCNPRSSHHDPEVETLRERIKIKNTAGSMSVDAIVRVKAAFIQAAGETTLEEGGVEDLYYLVEKSTGLPVSLIRNIVYNHLCNPDSKQHYDAAFHALKDDHRKKHRCTKDEAELVKLKFVEVAKTFDSPPANGVLHIYGLVGKDLGMPARRVEHVIRGRFCKPEKELYDPGIRALKDSLKRHQAIIAEDQKEEQPAEAELRQWEYSDTGQILGAMETRIEKVEKVNVILRKENEDLISQVAKLEKRLANRTKARQDVSKLNERQAKIILDLETRFAAKTGEQADVIKKQVNEISVLEEEKSSQLTEMADLMLQLAKRERQIKKLELKKHDELRLYQETAAKNKRLEIKVRDQGNQILELEKLEGEWVAEINRLEKELKASRDGDVGKKAEATFIKRWSDRFLPKTEKKPQKVGWEPGDEAPF